MNQTVQLRFRSSTSLVTLGHGLRWKQKPAKSSLTQQAEKLEIKLTAAQAAALAASKAIYLKGQNAVVTEITYTTPGSKPSDSSSEVEDSSAVVEDSSTVVEDSSSTSENPSTEEVIWEGEEDLGAWKNDVELGVAGIPLAEENGILTIEYTATGAAQIQIINKLGEDWTWTPMETADGAEYF